MAVQYLLHICSTTEFEVCEWMNSKLSVTVLRIR